MKVETVPPTQMRYCGFDSTGACNRCHVLSRRSESPMGTRRVTWIKTRAWRRTSLARASPELQEGFSRTPVSQLGPLRGPGDAREGSGRIAPWMKGLVSGSTPLEATARL